MRMVEGVVEGAGQNGRKLLEVKELKKFFPIEKGWWRFCQLTDRRRIPSNMRPTVCVLK